MESPRSTCQFEEKQEEISKIEKDEDFLKEYEEEYNYYKSRKENEFINIDGDIICDHYSAFDKNGYFEIKNPLKRVLVYLKILKSLSIEPSYFPKGYF